MPIKGLTFYDVEVEQKKELDYKIQTAVAMLAEAFAVCKHRASLGFSGGKDSTVLWHLIRTHFPEQLHRLAVIYGNTGVEYPECVSFARRLAKEWGGENFYEAKPARTKVPGLKYAAQREVLDMLISTGRVQEVLKVDGKLRTTAALEKACPPEMWKRFEQEGKVWPAGTRQGYWWCVDQYGWPLLGKSASKLEARRINIDCFLQFSATKSTDSKLAAYYGLLRKVKFSAGCCKHLKKDPSKKLQKELGVDMVFLGLMASESRRRLLNFVTNGYLYQMTHDKVGSDPVYTCNPLSIWTDDDIWAYIHRFNVPYAELYDMGWTDKSGTHHKIKRNGCIGCATDLLFPNNHMSMMRRTHPRLWEIFMRKGMAAEIQKIQLAKRNGQATLYDVYEAEELMDIRPCIFDRIDKLVLDDETGEESLAFDPEM